MAVPVDFVEQAAERFRLLSDPTRLRLLNALDESGELSVGELARRSAVGLSTTSKHLNLLEREGVLARRRQGTTIYYRIADETIRELCDIVCAGLRRRFSALVEAAG